MISLSADQDVWTQSIWFMKTENITKNHQQHHPKPPNTYSKCFFFFPRPFPFQRLTGDGRLGIGWTGHRLSLRLQTSLAEARRGRFGNERRSRGMESMDHACLVFLLFGKFMGMASFGEVLLRQQKNSPMVPHTCACYAEKPTHKHFVDNSAW